MQSISLRVAYPIIIAGFFIMVSFIAVNYEQLNLGFYIVLFLLTIYIFLFGFATGQTFATPLKKLLQRADELIKGDLKSRLYLKNNDELGELAKTFNRIAEMLEESRFENERMEKSIDIKVKAKTQAMQEVIAALEDKVKNRTVELERVANSLEQVQNQLQQAQAQTTNKPKTQS